MPPSVKDNVQVKQRIRASFEIEWHDGESEGYTDILPADRFATQCPPTFFEHEIWGPRGGKYAAQCQLSVREAQADLDYEEFPQFNHKHGIYLGTMRLFFADQDRTSIREVHWKPSGESECVKAEVTPRMKIISLGPAQPYKGPSRPSTRVSRLYRERPGQRGFRRDLKLAYGGRCCLCECSVSQALDAAHIDSYDGPASDHLQNGLLLRQDLHALFDALQLGIDPDTRLAHFAQDALSWPEYRSWHKTLRLHPPRLAEHAPSNAALVRKWRDFISQEAKPTSRSTSAR